MVLCKWSVANMIALLLSDTLNAISSLYPRGCVDFLTKGASLDRCFSLVFHYLVCFKNSVVQCRVSCVGICNYIIVVAIGKRVFESSFILTVERL